MVDDRLLRAEAALAVCQWLTEYVSSEAAYLWAWECTPFPCGLPSDEQLMQGLSVALGERTLDHLLTEVHDRMAQFLADYKESASA